MGTNPSPEKGKSLSQSTEHQSALIVEQPHKLEGLLETITLLDKISERSGEDRSGDLGGAGAGAVAAGAQAQAGQSARDQAIANLPKELVLRKQLARHIEKEVKTLRKEVRRATRRVSKPGAAHNLNDLYARIRRLNSLLATILEASYEVVKRLFIRVFIDKQPIL
ncbi:hypothetical protein KKC44_06055 [Patescibacteria group bacterium]|nr:hypothetical protein [Patescibacteria group bacterium]MBU2260136.1 hypothetical protein [Patescibacteria group bacterium]